MNSLQRHDANQLSTCDWLIGIDEAGRGALAGPVVAGACVLEGSFFKRKEALRLSAGVNDSKQIDPKERERQFEQIQGLQAAGLFDFAVASASVPEIAELNILGATRLAMRRAVEALADRQKHWTLPDPGLDGPLFAQEAPVRLIVDGRPLRPFPYAHHSIVKGDATSLSIAIASVAAKVVRDSELRRLAEDYPGYGFDLNKGYGTRAHREAIFALGPCPAHRELFLRRVLAACNR